MPIILILCHSYRNSCFPLGLRAVVESVCEHWVSLLKISKIVVNLTRNTWKAGTIFISYYKTAGELSWKALHGSSTWKLLWFHVFFPCMFHVMLFSFSCFQTFSKHFSTYLWFPTLVSLSGRCSILRFFFIRTNISRVPC